LQAAESSDEVINSEAWIPLEKVALPFPEIDLNSTAANRFIHGQEVVVFKSGVENLVKDSSVVIRDAEGHLLGIGSVRAVLARGRTLNIAPSMVLDPTSVTATAPAETAGKLP
jgi:tRNA U55 pseudouridine synthase TruB